MEILRVSTAHNGLVAVRVLPGPVSQWLSGVRFLATRAPAPETLRFVAHYRGSGTNAYHQRNQQGGMRIGFRGGRDIGGQGVKIQATTGASPPGVRCDWPE